MALQPGGRVIERQQLERPYPGMLTGVMHDKGRDETRLQRYLATRKTLATAAAQPAVRVVALIGTRASGCLFQHGCRDSGDRRGVDRLPEHVAELNVIPKPNSAADLGHDGADLECGLI